MATMRRGLVLLLVIITNSYLFVDGSNITYMEILHTTLLTGYNKDVRPIDNQTAPVNVTITPFLRSIQDLNEVTGELSFTGALSFYWLDSKMIWDPAQHGGLDFIYLSYESVWVPEIIMTTTTEESDTFAKKWMKVKYAEYGGASFTVGGRYLASCSVDIENYPFDKQTCKVKFTAWGYDSPELIITAGTPTIDVSQFDGNSIWSLAKTEVETYTLQGWSYFNLNFYLERQASFTLVSLVSPLLLMNCLNVLVFVLVPDSGERVSYSVTVLLAIAVFLTIISDALPPSSDPIPKITYKLMADMIISVSITMVTILNLRLYHKDDEIPIPGRLQAIYRFFRSCCGSDESKIGNSQVGIIEHETAEVEEIKLPRERGCGSVQDAKITWKDISYMVDYISLVVFSSASVLTFMIYVITAAAT